MFNVRVIFSVNDLIWTSLDLTLDSCILISSRLICLFPRSVLLRREISSLRLALPPIVLSEINLACQAGYTYCLPKFHEPEWTSIRSISDSCTFQLQHSCTDVLDVLSSRSFSVNQYSRQKFGIIQRITGHFCYSISEGDDYCDVDCLIYVFCTGCHLPRTYDSFERRFSCSIKHVRTFMS